MKVFYNQFPNIKEAVAVIGTFDGCHLGHISVLNEAIKAGKSSDLPVVVITFRNHPLSVLAPESCPKMLMRTEEKIEKFSQYAVDYVSILDFTRELSGYSAEEFISLIGKSLRIRKLIIGYDFRMGYRGSGDRKYLGELALKHQFDLQIIPPQMYKGQPISSTRIRASILEGDLQEAEKMLGYGYWLEGKTVRGKHIGSTIDFPTANLAPQEEKIVPLPGAYFTNAYICGKKYKAITNIGHNPTVGEGNEVKIETHMLDAKGEFYDELLRVEFLKRIRSEEKFGSLDALKSQLLIDRENRRKFD